MIRTFDGKTFNFPAEIATITLTLPRPLCQQFYNECKNVVKASLANDSTKCTAFASCFDAGEAQKTQITNRLRPIR